MDSLIRVIQIGMLIGSPVASHSVQRWKAVAIFLGKSFGLRNFDTSQGRYRFYTGRRIKALIVGTNPVSEQIGLEILYMLV